MLQCLITNKQQPESALQQLDMLAARHVEGLRGLTKAIQDARLSRNNDAIRAAIQQYDEALERYIPGQYSTLVAFKAAQVLMRLHRTTHKHDSQRYGTIIQW